MRQLDTQITHTQTARRAKFAYLELLEHRFRFAKSVEIPSSEILTFRSRTIIVSALELRMFLHSTSYKHSNEGASSLPVQYMQQRAPSLDVAFRDPRPCYAPESGRFTVSNEVDIVWVSNRFLLPVEKIFSFSFLR